MMNKDFESYIKSGNEIFNQIHQREFSLKEYGIILFYLLQRIYNHEDFLLSQKELNSAKVYDSVSLIQKIYQGRNPKLLKSTFRNLVGLSKSTKENTFKSFIVIICKYFIFRITNIKSRIAIRNRIKSLEINDPRLAFLYKNFPVVFAEDLSFYKRYKYLNNHPISPYKLKDYFAIIYSNNAFGNNIIRFKQHGGFYGEIHPITAHEFEYFLSDEFYTWGWSYNNKQIPYYSDRLLKFKVLYSKINLEKNNQILILPPPMLENYNNFYNDLQDLSVKTKYSVIVKGYGKRLTFSKDLDKFWKSLEKCQFPIVEGDMKKFLKISRVALIGYFPSTAFLESISVNTPTIAIQSISDDDFCSEYLNHVEKLIAAGILHKSLESAVGFINQIEDLNVWWEGITKSLWFQNYLKTYCNTEKNDV